MNSVQERAATRPEIALRPLLHVRFTVAETGSVAHSDGSIRSVHRFTGGSFGGRLSGIVLPGGGDNARVRTADWVEIDAYAVLQSAAGANILLTYQGLWRAVPGAIRRTLESLDDAPFPESDHYLRTTARFEAGDPDHAWLNGLLAVGRGRKCAGGIEHSFFEVL